MSMSISTSVDVDIDVDEEEMIQALEKAGYTVLEGDGLTDRDLESVSYDLISLARTHTNQAVRDAYLHAAQMVMERQQ